MRKIIFTLLVSISGLSLASAQFSGGNGTSGSPYLISSATDLASITGSYVTGGFYFRQTADINITSYLNWTPIGTITSQFNGYYDGNGKTISNLTTTGTSTYRGLFGATDVTAVIINLSLTSVSVSGGNFTSALVGQNRGKINNCSSQGNVTGRIPTGGLVAYNLNTGDVINSYSNCVVAGRNTVGGLIGQNEGNVSFSYASGSLSSNTITYATIGGFIASNAGNLSQCFATVNVSSSVLGTNGGAFVGVNTSGGVITNCYSNGAVVVDEDPENEAVAGGFIVSNYGAITNSYSRGTVLGSQVAGFAILNSGSINNCFWDEGTFGAIGSDGGTATSTASMQTISTFTGAGWSFECEVWGINGSDNDLYPFLLWQDDYVLPASDCNYWTGSSSTAWAISDNWSGGVPSSGSNILIRSTASNFPEVTSDVSLNITNVGKNASLTITPTSTYTSTGQLINNGYIIINPVGK